jgi:phosphoenolpyruvate carboxykinase (ATP)
MKLKYTRAIIDAIHDGSLAKAPTVEDPVFGAGRPDRSANVPARDPHPRRTRGPTRQQYDAAAKKVAVLFSDNFKKYEAQASAEVRAAGPKL